MLTVTPLTQAYFPLGEDAQSQAGVSCMNNSIYIAGASLWEETLQGRKSRRSPGFRHQAWRRILGNLPNNTNNTG